MTDNIGRIHSVQQTDAVSGVVRWSPAKSIWFNAHLLVAIFVAPFLISVDSVLVFVILTGITLCFGHSLGMHRLLIHRSYECPLWMEYLFIYLGVLVGMAGPIGMIRQHDLRDWAQRQKGCHDYLLHGSNLVKDGWWQLNCDLFLNNPPEYRIEERVTGDPVYRFLERTWMIQQVILAAVLYALGGLSWVAWGVSVRVVVSVGGHWLIGYFAHNTGERTWKVELKMDDSRR